MGSIINSIYSRYCSLRFRHSASQNERIHLRDPDIEESKPPATSISQTSGLTVKQRALLIGISYAHSQSHTWWSLENPHDDVDMFRNLLVHVYGYLPGEITVLKDSPSFPDHLQPTRENMIRELTSLVADAASGDKFTFFYSGHTDQQKSFDDITVEEDAQDEVIITSDVQRIVDNELNDIIVKPLPAGSFLLAVFDTCHSGTMLDLPHHHCNSVYVPWRSKSDRGDWPLNKRWWSMRDSEAHPGREGRLQRRYASAREGHRPRIISDFPSPARYNSPVSNAKCDGWCAYDPFARRIALSLSSFSEPQRAWEGPRGSLTAVLCKYLEKYPCPSYRNMMSHISSALHENARELHTYTRQQKKDGNGFDGELDDFQEPKLSSLSKLNMDDIFPL